MATGGGGGGSSSSTPSSSIISHTLHPTPSHPYMKPPLPSPSFRQQGNLQRSHPPHPHLLHTFSPSQMASSQRIQHIPPSQIVPLRTIHPVPQQLPPSRSHIPSIQRSSPLPITAAPLNKSDVIDADESANRILRKRSIQELVFQIDPSERLESGVEEILEDIANDFVESITTFGCTLAKHRKSTTLEAKDILLHLERNWNMVIPGFSGDEIKTFRKPVVVDVHRERLAAVRFPQIKKSEMATATETQMGTKNTSANAKSHTVKLASNAICQDS